MDRVFDVRSAIKLYNRDFMRFPIAQWNASEESTSTNEETKESVKNDSLEIKMLFSFDGIIFWGLYSIFYSVSYHILWSIEPYQYRYRLDLPTVWRCYG